MATDRNGPVDLALSQRKTETHQAKDLLVHLLHTCCQSLQEVSDPRPRRFMRER